VTPWGTFELADPPAPGSQQLVLIRPEAIRRTEEGGVAARVTARSFRGERVLLRVEVGGAPLEISAAWLDPPSVGDEVRLAIEPQAVQLVG
jgi:ABC-type Fe3+/spermidine/putrescine transport system ATPase subunit